MINKLLVSIEFKEFISKKIEKSLNSIYFTNKIEPVKEGFYIVSHKFSLYKEIVFLCQFEIKNKRFKRLGINEYLFFENVLTYSFIDL